MGRACAAEAFAQLCRKVVALAEEQRLGNGGLRLRQGAFQASTHPVPDVVDGGEERASTPILFELHRGEVHYEVDALASEVVPVVEGFEDGWHGQ